MTSQKSKRKITSLFHLFLTLEPSLLMRQSVKNISLEVSLDS